MFKIYSQTTFLHTFRLQWIVIFVSIFFFPNSFAQQIEQPKKAQRFWEFSSSLGNFQGKSQEFVYDPRTLRKASQLNWYSESAVILKGKIGYDLFQWLNLSLGGWSTLGGGALVMDDYDWLNPASTSWTHWSHHPNSQLRYANEYNINLTGWFFEKQNYRLGALAGFERSSVSYLALGGCYTYERGLNVGCFAPDRIVIGYQQKFDTGYVGLVGEVRYYRFSLEGAFKFGPSAHGSDVDQHYRRSLTFKDYGRHNEYYFGSLIGSYKVNPDFNIFIEGNYNNFVHQYADAKIINNITDETFFQPKSSGLSYTNFVLALGIKYNPSFG